MTAPEPVHVPRLLVVTRETDAVDDLLEYADPGDPLVWLRRGNGFVGAPGAPAAVLSVTGEERVRGLSTRWRELVAQAEIDDAVGVPGTGLVGFAAFVFDDVSAATSTIIVPPVIVGRRQGRAWITYVTRVDEEADAGGTSSRGDATSAADAVAQPAASVTPYGPHWSGTVGPGALDPDAHQAAVRRALDVIATGGAEKVVVARDLVGTVPAGSDLRRLPRALSTGYPDCWTFGVDGLIGASPETLVTARDGTVTARVLAGTIGRGADADADTAASLALATSAKDQDEHQYAVQSVLRELRPHTSVLAASEQPFMLRLPNVWHLATDVEGTLAHGESVLELVAAIHPTAAVAGTPTDAAIDAIRRIEPFDRGRYAGPVGWVDASGDGEFAIALRCAQFDVDDARAGRPIRLTAHAGGGIVEGSDPEAELLETRVKFRPIVDALA